MRKSLRWIDRSLSRACIFLVKGYQRLFSPLTRTSCRFYPSCSSYAMSCFQTHGAVLGGWLSLKRLLRCHPWRAGGIDLPPE